MRRSMILPLAAVTALALGGCEASVSVGKKLDTDKAESVIKDGIAKLAQTTVDKVECPDDVKIKKGAKTTCKAFGPDGTSADVEVVQKDDKGNVNYSAPLLHIREAEQAIAQQVETQSSASGVTVDCPDLLLAKSGRSFNCKGNGGGRDFKVDAQFTDDQGHFTFNAQQ